ncbi:BglG family transcription antiterminator [Tetragenococcus solitarius]|uniref:PRD domain-containing protein n=1 Tax=Tetragenococcus solitarius TaxID=71453 RepID=A0ABN3YCJ7_9ENTE|nr:BglG family transcription antiterminator [Tetragenococcus solitarius]
MLNAKERLIIKTLYENQHTYMTSQELAVVLYISDRTTRKYLHQADDLIKNHGAVIEAKQGQGYRLWITEDDKFHTFYQKEVKEASVRPDVTMVQESEDRQYFILNRLFFERSRVFVDDLAEELFVSRSTISNDIVEIKKMIAPYDLELNSRTKSGIFVAGSEQNKRHFIMNYFFMDRLHDNLYTFSMYTDLLMGIQIEEIVIIVLDECRESKLKLSDFIIYNIVLHIGLAIKRLQSGFNIEMTNAFDVAKDSIEYQTAKRMIRRIEKNMQVKFPEEEASYISLHLRNKSVSHFALNAADSDETKIRTELLHALEELDKETGFSFQKDTVLINGLLMHFTPLLTRLQNHTSIENPLLTEIKQNYPDIFALTIKHLGSMPIFQQYEVAESEWAYLTIHLTAAMERYFNAQKAHIIVICATGLGSSQLLKMRLEHELGSKVVIDHVIGYYEISEDMLKNTDLIVSSITLPQSVPLIPVVHVSVFLDQDDIQAINHELAKIKGKEILLSRSAPILTRPQHQLNQQLIEQCFKPELFLYFDQPMQKEVVIEALITKINAVESKDIKEKMQRQLQLREHYNSVAFSKYLAVPHPIEAVTESAHVAVAVAPKGIFWDQEHPEVQLVFLSSPDRFFKFPMEEVNKLFIPIIENDQIRQALSACTTYQEFMEVFCYQV